MGEIGKINEDLMGVLAALKLYSDGQEYVVIHLPPAAITAAAGIMAEVSEPFSAVLADKDEVTLVLPRVWWDDFSDRLPGHLVAAPFRLITFDVPLAPDLVGFMTVVSRALADVNVPLMALSGYERDHLLVPAARFDAAWAALQELRPGG